MQYSLHIDIFRDFTPMPELPIPPQVDTHALVAWLASQESAMQTLLQQIVDIDSGSGHIEGVERVAAALRARLEAAGMQVRMIAQPGYGSCLHARMPQDANTASTSDVADSHILLMGHMDTVFPPGTAAARPWRVDNGRAYGPGVADMKSGLVMNTFVAEAFARLGRPSTPLQVFFSCDEEVGSPSSRDTIREVATGARAVLNAEPGRISGNVVTARKGSYHIDFEVLGVAAHSGINPAQGASAITALAHKTLALHALTESQPGVTLNVGVVQGGMAANVVAPQVSAQLDLRYTAETDLPALLAQVRAVIETESLPRTQGRIVKQTGTLPMRETPAELLALYQRCAQASGFSVEGEFTGGAADSGITSTLGIPTLCALGPVGGYAHSEREFCDLSTMVPRAQALARTIVALG